jgi:hypothetical protein
MTVAFRNKYGPWALVAGASEGLGGEFARALAARGVHLFLIARREALLEQTAGDIRARHGVEVRTAALDLASADLAERIRTVVEQIEIGLLVYNAAFSQVSPFLDQDLDTKMRMIDVNCRGPLVLTHEIGKAMASRRRGGIILMSSMAARQGTAGIANYAATKSYSLVLAEGLWHELREHGIDVLACSAGAIRTPNLLRVQKRQVPGTMEPGAVAAEALDALGKTPSMVPGRVNRAVSLLLSRVLPRRLSIEIMGRETMRSMGE